MSFSTVDRDLPIFSASLFWVIQHQPSLSSLNCLRRVVWIVAVFASWQGRRSASVGIALWRSSHTDSESVIFRARDFSSIPAAFFSSLMRSVFSALRKLRYCSWRPSLRRAHRIPNCKFRVS